ncbi:helix-turn-helix domain-containing protein, partial [Nocardia beijingensis]|uniref:helix-turn-helix domain-containing protein n=1 Tax=Nocardia beijingensis TaxID=95162 RepID=UPI0012F4D49F
MSTDLGERLRSVRKRSGLTQRELAQSSGVSLSLIRKIEQGERDDTRIQTLRRLAVAMGCPLSALLGPTPGRPETEGGELWLPTRRALVSIADGHAAETPAERSMNESLVAAVKLYHDNEYEQLSRLLPHLIVDGRAATPLMRSRILQLVGSVLVQTRQLQSASTALEQSLRDAESTGNVLDAASAVITLCWLLLVERQFEQVRTLAVSWADRIEPRLSVATTRELSTWGWLLLRGSV